MTEAKQGLTLNKIPFDNLRIAYFRVFDKPGEKIFLDATDEQILNLLVKEFHETVVISRIEDVEVLSIVTVFPAKRKLNPDELKSGITNEERVERQKVKEFKEKYK